MDVNSPTRATAEVRFRPFESMRISVLRNEVAFGPVPDGAFVSEKNETVETVVPDA